MEAPVHSGFYRSMVKFHDPIAAFKPDFKADDLISVWVAGFASGFLSALKGGGDFSKLHSRELRRMTHTDVEALHGDVEQIGKDMATSLVWVKQSPGGPHRVGQGRRPEYAVEQQETGAEG